VLATAPAPHPYFECYVATLDRRYFGLWRVVGIGKDIPLTPTRRAVRRVFTSLEKPLLCVFGPGVVSTPWPRGRSPFPNEPDEVADAKGMMCRYWVLDRTASPQIEGAVLAAYPSPDNVGKAYIRLATTFRYYNPHLDQRRRTAAPRRTARHRK
jgi:hypothetical protein